MGRQLVCVYVYMSVSVYLCLCVYVCVSMYVRLCMCVYVCVSMSVCLCLCIYVCAPMSVSVSGHKHPRIDLVNKCRRLNSPEVNPSFGRQLDRRVPGDGESTDSNTDLSYDEPGRVRRGWCRSGTMHCRKSAKDGRQQKRSYLFEEKEAKKEGKKRKQLSGQTSTFSLYSAYTISGQ